MFCLTVKVPGSRLGHVGIFINYNHSSCSDVQVLPKWCITMEVFEHMMQGTQKLVLIWLLGGLWPISFLTINSLKQVSIQELDVMHFREVIYRWFNGIRKINAKSHWDKRHGMKMSTCILCINNALGGGLWINSENKFSTPIECPPHSAEVGNPDQWAFTGLVTEPKRFVSTFLWDSLVTLGHVSMFKASEMCQKAIMLKPPPPRNERQMPHCAIVVRHRVGMQ